MLENWVFNFLALIYSFLSDYGYLIAIVYSVFKTVKIRAKHTGRRAEITSKKIRHPDDGRYYDFTFHRCDNAIDDEKVCCSFR